MEELKVIKFRDAKGEHELPGPFAERVEPNLSRALPKDLRAKVRMLAERRLLDMIEQTISHLSTGDPVGELAKVTKAYEKLNAYFGKVSPGLKRRLGQLELEVRGEMLKRRLG